VSTGRRRFYAVLGLVLILIVGTTIWSISRASNVRHRPPAHSATSPAATNPTATSYFSIPAPGAAGSGWVSDGGCGPQRKGCDWTPMLAHGHVELTDTNTFEAGSDFYATPLRIEGSSSITVTFDLTMKGGSHSFGTPADGATVDLLDDNVRLPVVGTDGGGLGWTGLHGIGVAFTTFDDATKGTDCGDPSSNFIAIIDGARCVAGSPCSGICMRYVLGHFAGSSLPSLTGRTNKVSVTFTSTGTTTGTILVSINGHEYLTESNLTFPRKAFLGFTGATGGDTDTHIISDFTGIDSRVTPT
jgi:Bacterial lectin